MKFPRITRRITMLLAASALLLGIPAAATASAASATSGTGWIRLAHLSPNTPAVDVYLYSFGNSNAQIVLHHVAYGTVSPYEVVTAGDYSVAMRASGASPSSQPVLSTSVTVKADHAYTVAGMGPESGLRLQVLDDQLTTPSGKSVDPGHPGLAEAADGQVHLRRADDRAQGDVRLREFLHGHPGEHLDHGGDRLRRQLRRGALSMAPGTVHTMVVLDGTNGLEIVNLVDAAGAGKPPAGGVTTGFGGTAGHGPGSPVPWLALIGAGALITLTGGFRLRRHGLRRQLNTGI